MTIFYSLHQTRLSFLKSKDSLEGTSLFSNAAVDETLEKDTVFSDSDSESDNEEELEEEGDESDDEHEIVTLHDNMLQSFEKRMKKLSHDYAILAWICCVHPDVRSDVNERFEKTLHEDAVERITTKLYAHVVDANMAEILNTFWKEWKMFVQETGVFSKRNMWNVRDALDGKSTEWHELYSRGRTEVLGYVAPRCTSAMTGMGASERAWACTKKS